jgi:hypothetical protein
MSGRHRPNKKQGTRVGYERDPAAETRRRRSEKSLPAAGQRIRRKTNFTRRSKTEPLSGEINEEKQASTYTESEWEIENKKIKKRRTRNLALLSPKEATSGSKVKTWTEERAAETKTEERTGGS